ncbi:hypothetical protein DFH28DRAFT_1074763 [Melampsora americana]|nr:hypothetical protein DFH28DRAFT_1074763 [Melampsora americana]
MSGRRKVITKETESGTVLNMLTSNQENQINQTIQSTNEQSTNPDISAKDASRGSNRQIQDPNTLQSNPSDQGDSAKSKSPVDQLMDRSGHTKSGNQGKDLVNPDYLAILGDKPPAGNKDVHISINLDSDENINATINLSDKDAVFSKAMECSKAGDSKETSKYLEIYESLTNSLRPPNQRAISMVQVIDLEEKTIPDGAVFENGMWFFPGLSSDYNNRSYTPYFDKNIQELRYPIPLTIFDKEWQTRAMTCHIKKRPRSYDSDAKSDSPYNGLPYADEWLLDYGEWCVYYDTFISVLSTKFTKFTEWVRSHKENVAKVLASKGWMTALKYDMRVRENALVNRIEINGKVAPPDISKYDQMLVEECFDESRMRGELNFKKNPYVEGGEREGWDPATGTPPRKVFEKSNQVRGKNFTRWGNTQRDESPSASGSGTQVREKKKFRRGYQGSNFDENYAEKRAAAAAATKDNNTNK